MISTNPFSSQTLTDPDRLEVRDTENNWVATFTLGSYTVTLRGQTHGSKPPRF